MNEEQKKKKSNLGQFFLDKINNNNNSDSEKNIQLSNQTKTSNTRWSGFYCLKETKRKKNSLHIQNQVHHDDDDDEDFFC